MVTYKIVGALVHENLGESHQLSTACLDFHMREINFYVN